MRFIIPLFLALTSASLQAQIDITCPDDVVVHADKAPVAVNYPTPTSSSGTITCSPPSGSLFSRGTNVVTCIASDGVDNANCTFNLIVQAPPDNDDFDFATFIPSIPYTNVQDTSFATAANDDPGCWWPGNSVWYKLIVPQTMDIGFRADGAGTVGAYSGTRGNLVGATCAPYGVAEFIASSNQTYYLLIDAPQYSPGGYLKLSVFELPVFTYSVTVDPNGSFDKTGQAIIHGTVKTSRPSGCSLRGTVRQRMGRQTIITGNFQAYFSCQSETNWDVLIPSTTAAFGGGAADVSITAYACDTIISGTCVSQNLSATVKLKGANH